MILFIKKGDLTMNKSERINDMMIFLNDKNSFNLTDIINKYNISKSTALRDIETLERIGMPLYSVKGRNGCYKILNNRLLSPIVFNIEEVFALYFSMLTLRAYETTPFHLSVEKLKEKFENCLPSKKIEMLHKAEKVFSLASIQHNNQCPFLKEILQYASEEKVSEIIYKEYKYYVQFFNISSAYGQWYGTGYNFEKNKIQVFRCDKISEIKESNKYHSKSLSEFLKSSDLLYKNENAVDFEIEITEKGVDLFFKEHYPSMKLHSENNKQYIRGFYNPDETDFISNYFINFGESILSIKPLSLKKLIIDKLNSRLKYCL